MCTKPLMQRFHKLWDTPGPACPTHCSQNSFSRRLPCIVPAVDASHSLPRCYSTSPLDAFGHRVSVHCSEMPDQNDISVDRTFKQASSVFV
ncbi:hypothetical protein PISMIDRAFT_686947 [Pisolithus microcarpus 441]|uniref:Unplaced genomic scaffold scaffold_193, whole genome shotgun sequence n=1 Tax=Pisolithus microcarpus 441 TaxID=765257 RepID=A0A0C9Z0D9_9AGAM|nr:hypothetical protein PISMIDRAFT_686947 [Pisolithus microcarpus 441]